MSGAEHRQVGPPLRVHNYLVRVVDDEDSDVLCEAVHVGPDRLHRLSPAEDHFYFPRSVQLTPLGIVVEDVDGSPALLPTEVVRALLKIGSHDG